MQCTVCTETQLEMTSRQDIEIDYCQGCRGVWLDRGELDKIIERSQREQPFAALQPQAVMPASRDVYRNDSGHGGGKHESFFKRLFDRWAELNMAVLLDIVNPAPARSKRWGIRVVLWMGVTAAASGCTAPYEGRYDFNEGWRKAEVKRIEPFEKLAPHQIPRCEPATPFRAAGGSTWAIVRYRGVRRSREVAVPVTPSDDYKVGELVYVNVSECVRQIQRRAAAH